MSRQTKDGGDSTTEGGSDSTAEDGTEQRAGDGTEPTARGETEPTAKGEANPSCYCPLGGAMDLLGRKYAIQLVCVVGAVGPVRYGDIEDAFGDVSSSTLSARLDDLVSAGYLSRQQYAEIPPRVEYDLTESGEELCRRLEPLLEWAERQDDLPSAA